MQKVKVNSLLLLFLQFSCSLASVLHRPQSLLRSICSNVGLYTGCRPFQGCVLHRGAPLSPLTLVFPLLLLTFTVLLPPWCFPQFLKRVFTEVPPAFPIGTAVSCGECTADLSVWNSLCVAWGSPWFSQRPPLQCPHYQNIVVGIQYRSLQKMCSKKNVV